MTVTLYHYVHCPFCIRVRMALGLLKQEYRSVVLPYNDESTPVKLTGVKMLPIAEIDGKVINESLDIMKFLDHDQILKITDVTSRADFKNFEKLLEELGSPVHSLAMPYWVYTPEFDESSRKYFRQKKELKRGPFSELVKNQKQFIKQLNEKLSVLSKDLKPFYQSTEFGLKDILLASHIWGLYVVPEFQFEPKIHDYLQSVKEICGFNYHQPLWEKN